MTHALTYTPEKDAPSSRDRTPGTFIVFEGGDGSGKTTQISLLARALTDRGFDVLTTREPGGTEIGEKLRTLVLDHGQGQIDPRTEALIFAASRAAHVQQKIRPALEAGRVVLCDRYMDSSAAYQGAGRNLGIENILDLSRWATEDLQAHTTILLDVTLEEGRARTGARGQADRMESADGTFHRALHQTFRDLAQVEPVRYRVIDGARDVETVHREVLAAALEALGDPETPA